jgi:two-component system nitrate/nitrite response regulator NarL
MVLRLQPTVRRALARARVTRATSILIVADTRLYRDGLARSLGRRQGIRVVGASVGPEDALAQLRERSPDVVVLDLADDGLSRMRTLFRAVPDAKVVVLGLPESDADVVAYAEAGVSGFVARDSSLDELAACVRSVACDDLVFSPRVAAILLEQVKALASGNGGGPRRPALTSRQLEVLQLVDVGLSNKEIAQRLCIEVSTVKNHVHQVLDKLHVRSRTEASATFRSWSRGSLGVVLLASEVFDALPTLDALPL